MTDTSPFLMCSVDPGGSSDPAALCVAKVSQRDRLTHTQILHMAIRKPPVAASAHTDFIATEMAKTFGKLGHGTVRYIVDISSNTAIAFLLCQALPAASLVGVRITNSEAHGAGVTPLLVGDVGGRATSIPVITLSRKQMLLNLGAAFATAVLTLPLTDPEQAKMVNELKLQMSRASLKDTPAGRQVAVVQRGHDDLLMSVAQLYAATRLPPPRAARRGGEKKEPLSSAAWT
jgi:hypothetical protein